MQSLNLDTMPFPEVVRTYEARHGVSVAQVAKAATQIGFVDRLESDLRSALTTGHPIQGWDSYVLHALASITSSLLSRAASEQYGKPLPNWPAL